MSNKHGGASELSAITEQAMNSMEGGRVRRRPLPAPTSLMNASTDAQEIKDEVRRLKAAEGRALRVRIDQCDDGESHAAPLNPERLSRTKANIAAHGQTTPALVRLKADGRYEILAGRHRKYAMLELGEEMWDITIQEVDDKKAIKSSFYDNLISAELSDYEKFRGYRRLRDEFGMSLESIADETGSKKSSVASFFVFDKLPEDLLGIVEQNQKRLTYSLIEVVVPFVDQNPSRVKEVLLHAVANEKATIRELAGMFKAQPTTTAPSTKPEQFKSGKKPYAELVAKEGRLVISIKSKDPAETKVLEKLIADVLRARANELKS